MITAAEVKEGAKQLGADLVGIAPMERWEGAPIQMDPRYIMPEAKSAVVMGFRIFRGSLRGIEEGTFFSNYSSMGYGGLNWLYMPLVVYKLCKIFEDEGYEAIPLGHLSPWRAIDNAGNVQEHSVPVRPGLPRPDVMVHHRIAAFLAGLGEIGYSKVFLSPQYGPRQRLGLVLTEAELEPDPIYDGPPLCDRCMLCATNCPGNAISTTKTVKVTVAGHELEWTDLDLEACNIAFRGAVLTEDGEKGDYLANRDDARPSFISPFKHKPSNIYIHGQAICGGRGCMRACMIHLEEQGKLSNEFHQPFRRRKPWRIDW